MANSHSPINELRQRALIKAHLLGDVGGADDPILAFQANVLDALNVRAIVQPLYSPEEQKLLEHWRECVIQASHERTTFFSAGSMVRHRLDSKGGVKFVCEHKAMRIPEIVYHVIAQADADTQFSSWHVSRAWRQCVRLVMVNKQSSQFWRSVSRHSPVEYADLQNEAADAWSEPSPSELVAFEKHVADTLLRVQARSTLRQLESDRGWPSKILYFPARFTQAKNLSTQSIDMLANLNQDQTSSFQRQYIAVEFDKEDDPAARYWLDFSQFQINPYFSAMLGSRMTTPMGRIEIAFQPSTNIHKALFSDLVPENIVDMVGSMFLTQPPCKTIGIYRNAYTTIHANGGYAWAETSHKELIVRIYDPAGIKLAQIIAALIHHASAVLQAWLQSAKDLADMVTTGHWQEDIWRVPASPRFILLLDKKDMSAVPWIGDGEYFARLLEDENYVGPFSTPNTLPPAFRGHSTRVAYLVASGFRKAREREWVARDLLDPGVSGVRGPINWDI